MKKASMDALFLSMCALKGEVPPKDRVEKVDMGKLFAASRFHSLTSLVCMALESVGMANKAFIDAKYASMKKVILYDAERENLFAFMEEKGIWHVPMKGIIMKDIYPKAGMREMSDNDIFYNKEYQQEVKEYMESAGYTVKLIGDYYTDKYTKEPYFCFEMHNTPFNPIKINPPDYYENVLPKLIKVEGKRHEYRFTNEDFYIYMTVHEFKHHIGRGVGMRAMIDALAFLRAFEDSMDMAYVEKELSFLGISEYEKEARMIAKKLMEHFEPEDLSEKEKELLGEFIQAGTYGFNANSVYKKMNKFQKETGSKSKTRYILSRVFPGMDFYKKHYPFYYKHKALLPFLWVKRSCKALFKPDKDIKEELKAIKNKK